MKKAFITALCVLMGLTVMASCDGGSAESGSSEASTTSGTTAATTAAESSEESVAELSGELTLTGSTSMEKVAAALAGAFEAAHDGVTVTVGGGGSGQGMTDAIEGKADIGMASRALKDEELADLEATVVGIDGISIIVNLEVGVDDITLADLEKIYAGEITNWSDLGGDDSPIVVIGREEGSGTRDGFESIVMTADRDPVYAQELSSTGTVISTVGSTAGAIGYASLANVDDTVKTLTVEGVTPTEATVLDGTYKIQRPFNMAIQKGNSDELVAAFMDYVMSAEGQEQVKAGGAVPVA